MSESKTSTSGADSYAAIGDYWDQHDLDSHWDQTRDAEFVVDLRGSSIYFPVERALAEQLRTTAETQGVSPEALLNLWIRERVTDEPQSK